MNKKELTNTIKQLAFHYGERVTCEWLSPDGFDWIEWKNAEINTLFLVDLEKGYIRNIQISDQYSDILGMVVANSQNIAELAERLTPGNVSHDGRTILGIARRNAEYFKNLTI